MFENHDYGSDQVYFVAEIDPRDSTLRARDARGALGSWIRWQDCRADETIGWNWLKGRLPAEDLELLSAFNGLERLSLRPEIAAALISDIPTLRKNILDSIEKIESAARP
jgi:hypothetical protein